MAEAIRTERSTDHAVQPARPGRDRVHPANMADGTWIARATIGRTPGRASLSLCQERIPVSEARRRVAVIALLEETGFVVPEPQDDWPRQDRRLTSQAMLGDPVMVRRRVDRFDRNRPDGAGGLHGRADRPGPDLCRPGRDRASVNARLFDAVERQRIELSRFVSPQVADARLVEPGRRAAPGRSSRATSRSSSATCAASPRSPRRPRPRRCSMCSREYHALDRRADRRARRHARALRRRRDDGLLQRPGSGRRTTSSRRSGWRSMLQRALRRPGRASGGSAGTELGLGIGIAAGYATLGRIGYRGPLRLRRARPRHEPRLAAERHRAEPGQTLISQRVFAAVDEVVDAEPVGELELKGFGRPVATFEVRGRRPT